MRIHLGKADPRAVSGDFAEHLAGYDDGSRDWPEFAALPEDLEFDGAAVEALRSELVGAALDAYREGDVRRESTRYWRGLLSFHREGVEAYCVKTSECGLADALARSITREIFKPLYDGGLPAELKHDSFWEPAAAREPDLAGKLDGMRERLFEALALAAPPSDPKKAVCDPKQWTWLAYALLFDRLGCKDGPKPFDRVVVEAIAAKAGPAPRVERRRRCEVVELDWRDGDDVAIVCDTVEDVEADTGFVLRKVERTLRYTVFPGEVEGCVFSREHLEAVRKYAVDNAADVNGEDGDDGEDEPAPVEPLKVGSIDLDGIEEEDYGAWGRGEE